MKFRKQMPAPPAPTETEEVTAARAIAAAVNQGMSGVQFAMVLNTMDPGKVRQAAGMTLHELLDWFKHDGGARQVLDRVPMFTQFANDFHKEAQRMYPDDAKKPPAGEPEPTSLDTAL